MNAHFPVLLLTAVANVLFGVAVWIRNPSNRINQYFGVFSVAIGVWALSNGLVNLFAASPSGILWARLAFAAATAISFSFLMFVQVFPSGQNRFNTLSNVFVACGAVILSISLFTPLIAQRTSSYNGALQVSYGTLHPLFAIYFVATLTVALLVLGKKRTALRGLERLQVTYVLISVASAAFGATVTNLFFPLLTGSSRLSAYGPVFSILLIALIAHSIIRYRLMNIRVVIRRGVTYLLAASAAGGVFLLLAWSVAQLLLSQPHIPLWLALVSALLVAVLFDPLKTWIQAHLDVYVFRQTYDYQQTVREFSRNMATLLELPALIEYSCETIVKAVHPETLTIYSLDAPQLAFEPVAVRTTMPATEERRAEPLSRLSPIPCLFSETKSSIIASEVGRTRLSLVASQAASELARLNAELALPIIHDGTVRGFFLLGPKLSGDPYFSEDLDLLTTLVSQIAIAIKNAQLYSQVLLANEYIENILSTMESGVIAVSAEGAITLFNAAAARLTRFNAPAMKGDSLARLPGPIASTLQETLKTGTLKAQVETAIEDEGGSSTPIICSTSAFRGHDGRVMGAVAVFSDLTNLKKLETEKRRAERLASIGAFASGIAHEIKNPLVAIRTFAELLPERFTDEDFRSDFRHVVIREVARIDDLVARLRGLATTPSNVLRPLDLRGPIEETLALLRAQLEQSAIRVQMTSDTEEAMIRGDWAQLKQLFLNVFVNSIEAMTSTGCLDVRLYRRDVSQRSTIVAEVRDTGTGIPEGISQKLFDPFFTTKENGSGLGLSICRGIADVHRAVIRVQNNQESRGATVTIEFPAAEPSESTSPAMTRSAI